MSGEYVNMWKELGLDLESHDQLLSVLGQAYGDIFLSQKNRPEGMKYFDFVVSEVHGLRIREIMEEKAKGNIIVGTFCVYVPEELVLAVGGVQIGLCAGAEIAFEKVEEYLPRNTCALIKSSLGFRLGRLCPYTQAADFVVGETTCDGKKKAYEIFGEMKDVYVMEIPQMKNDADRALWKKEIGRFTAELEKRSGRKITAESLKKGIQTVNKKRAVLQRLAAIRYKYPFVISGRDALLVNQVSFYDNPERFTDSVAKLCDELEERGKKKISIGEAGAKKILVSGCPMAVPNWKVPFVVETSGATIVAEESCVGERNTRNAVKDSGSSVDQLLDNIVDRYMKINCACFTPNKERIEDISALYASSGADGVIHYSLQFCTPYLVESKKVKDLCDSRNMQFLAIETDYSSGDMEQLKTRIEAFIEKI
ncbi:MAG: 2-hydroxyacyl-CoA dehydratase [Spirochaetes bacterium]|nr:2-hydroxyacyl-CoA dehydratase [Spirochaetota bacterium]